MTSNRITKEHIDALIAASSWTDTKMGEKTTVVCCKLPNGFEVIESSGCVDPANYDHKLGVEICLKRIVDQIWKLEGYALADRIHYPGPKIETSDVRKVGEWPTLECSGLSFGGAIIALKNGKKVARAGWNGKRMWILMQIPDANSKMTLPYLYIEYPNGHPAYTNGSRVPWLASQTDMLSNDWMLVD